MSRALRRRQLVLTVAATALVAGCAVGPNFVAPEPHVPAQWLPQSGASAAFQPAETADLRTWWVVFNDPTLDSLVERAVTSNLDLRAAVLRIDEARAQRDVTASTGWPGLSVDASYSRQRISETTPTGSLLTSVGNIKLPGGAGINIPNPYNQYQLSAGASWEIDLFGRIRRLVEGADAAVQVSVEDRHAVQVSLTSDVAETYMALRAAQSRLLIERENIATLQELLDLTRARRAAGLTTQIDVSNALAQHSATRAELPATELQITQGINQLSQLLAREPGALRSELASAATIPSVPTAVPIGLPADMARRRPDIRQAEANLHAATAQIGVAVADLFPRLTLSGTGGYQSDAAGNLLEWASRFGSIGPTLSVPLFDRGRWKTVHLQDVRAAEAALGYQRTVLNALHEVQNFLAAYEEDRRRRTLLAQTVKQNGEALVLSRQRYEAGVSSFVDVLNAQRAVQQNQALLLDSAMAAATDLVRVYRALGGGWRPEAPVASDAAP